MEFKISHHKIQRLLSLLLLLVVWSPSTPLSQPVSNTIENISINSYKQLAVPVPNPMDMTKISQGSSYQVTDPKFLLQFFFDGKSIFGIIFKREKESSLFLHWCFFRSCEESTYDIKQKIASAFTPPYDQAFFTAKLPPNLSYQFQGLKFYTVK
jgi:hypothetical protein